MTDTSPAAGDLGKRKFLIAACLIVMAGLALNVAGNWVGLDLGVLLFPQHLDISTVVMGGPMPHPFYGPLSYYVYAVPAMAAAKVRALFVHEPAPEMWLHQVGRVICGLLGAATVLLVMVIARMGLSRKAALIAGFLAAFSPGMVFMFHGESVNAVMTFFAVAACAAMAWLAYAPRERIIQWGLVAISGGLAATAKESCYGLMPGGLTGVFLARLAPIRPDFKKILLFVGKAAAVGGVAFAVYWTVNLSLFFPYQLNRHLDHYTPSEDASRLSEAEVERRSPEGPVLYFGMVEQNLGPSTVIWFALGTFILMRGRGGRALGYLFICVALVHYLTFGLWVHWFTYPSRGLKPYDVLFVSAIAAVPAAAALECIWSARKRMWRIPGRIIAVLVLSSVAVSGIAVDLALLHPSVTAPLRAVKEMPDRITLYEGIDVNLEKTAWVMEKVSPATRQDAQYALLVATDEEVQGMLNEGYEVRAEFSMPWQARLAPPGFRLQRPLLLLERPEILSNE